MVVVDLYTSLLAILLKSSCIAGGREGNVVTTQDRVTFEHKVTELYATSCATSYISLNAVINEEGYTLLSLSAPEHHEATPPTSVQCSVHLKSHPHTTISAVLLQHSPCGFGVFVVLWDGKWWKRWDVCSAWHVPGPDFTTSSNELNVKVEFSELHDPCDFIISVGAEKNQTTQHLEVHFLSTKEGKL